MIACESHFSQSRVREGIFLASLMSCFRKFIGCIVLQCMIPCIQNDARKSIAVTVLEMDRQLSNYLATTAFICPASLLGFSKAALITSPAPSAAYPSSLKRMFKPQVRKQCLLTAMDPG